MALATVKYRSPLLAILLLLTTYAIFSCYLYGIAAPWIVWLLALFIALLQALLLTTLSIGVRIFIRKWLKSDIGYFSMILLLGFSVTVILTWYQLFEWFVMLIGAELLARLDLQNAGLNNWQILGALTLLSIAGLAMGWFASAVLLLK